MTDEQINETLAKMLGLRGPDIAGYYELPTEDQTFIRADFATSRDAFHEHVVPVLEERGLMNKWAMEVCLQVEAESITEYPHILNRVTPVVSGIAYPSVANCLDAPPRTLCEAAIAVLKGNNDD